MGTGERRQREKDARRRHILSAARSLFWSRGYAATTMPEVARRAELAPGTLYLYFPGKDALYAELLVEGYDRLLERLQAAARRGASPQRRAAALVDEFFGFAREHPAYFDIIFFVTQREPGGGLRAVLGSEQLARLEAREAACKAIAASLIQEAGPRNDDEVRSLVEAVWSMLVGVVLFWGKDTAFARRSATARRVVLDALFAAPRRAQR